MALPDPILPQATGNTVQSSDIALVKGVAVSIPNVVGAYSGTLVSVFWDTRRVDAKVIKNEESDFPVVFLIPDEMTSIGQHIVSYTMEDEASNVSYSNEMTVTVA